MQEKLPSSPAEAPVKLPRERLHFSAADWLTFLPAAVLSLLFFRVFGLDSLESFGLPGLGITIFVFALFAAVLLVLGQRTHLEPAGCALCLARLALSLTFCPFRQRLYAYPELFFVLAVGAMGIFASPALRKRACGRLPSCGKRRPLSFTVLFRTWINRSGAGALHGRGKKSLFGIALGLLVALPVLCAVLMLLHRRIMCSAVCSSACGGEWLAGIARGPPPLARFYCTLLMTLLFFYALYALPESGAANGRAGRRFRCERGSGPVSPHRVLTLLDCVLSCLCGHSVCLSVRRRRGGCHEGRLGRVCAKRFFQLVEVSCINLAAVLAAAILVSTGQKKARREGVCS
jgi:hypothetical protein